MGGDRGTIAGGGLLLGLLGSSEAVDLNPGPQEDPEEAIADVAAEGVGNVNDALLVDVAAGVLEAVAAVPFEPKLVLAVLDVVRTMFGHQFGNFLVGEAGGMHVFWHFFEKNLTQGFKFSLKLFTEVIKLFIETIGALCDVNEASQDDV